MRNPHRTQNGHIDNGEQLCNGRTRCPNCGSSNFVESLSLEKCYSCGLECDYWGAGANQIYDDYQERREQKEREERERRDEKDDPW